MSYCRFGADGSEAYCYEASEGFVVWLQGPEKHVFHDAKTCAEFLLKCRIDHISIPQYAIDALLREAEEET